MAVTGCAKQSTFSEQIEATQYVQKTTQAAAPYATPAEATAAGYVPVSPTNDPVVYYVSPTIAAANAAARNPRSPVCRPARLRPDADGTEVLAAATYLLPTTLTSPADALRLPPAVASAHRCVRPFNLDDGYAPLRSPVRRPAPRERCRNRRRTRRWCGHLPAGGWTPGHSTPGHPNRRGFGHGHLEGPERPRSARRSVVRFS